MITKCFSFGYGQRDPITNEPIPETYARITAPTEDLCREIVRRMFGDKWSAEYGDNIEEIWPPGYKITERYHIFWASDHLCIPVPLPRRHPADYGSDDEEAALAIQTVLDPDDGGIFEDDAPVYRRVETVELPKEDVR